MNTQTETLKDTDQYVPLQGTATAEPTDFDALNELLRGELSATEAYDLAIRKFSNHAGIDELRIIRDEHAASSALLRDRILAHGGTPSDTSGTWGTFVSSLTNIAKHLGSQSILAMLRHGEEHGVKEYVLALDNIAIASECRELIAEDLLPRCRLHVGELEELSESLK